MKSACLVIAVLLLVACDSMGRGEPETLGPYTVWLSHDPAPLKVGYTTDFRLLLHDDAGEAVNGCDVALRQSMPGMEMSGGQESLHIHPGGDGVYTTHSRKFNMGGDWEIGLAIDCGQGPFNHTYRYTLEWPE